MHKNFLFFLSALLLLSSCIKEKKTNYEKFLECKSRSNKTSKEVDIMCFKENSLIGPAVDYIEGTGSPDLPPYGDGHIYNLFNRTDDLVIINVVFLSHEKSDEIGSIALSCTPKILYPNVQTAIACYNYSSKDDIWYKRYKENDKKNMKRSWHFGSTSVLKIKTKFKKP